jgi:hypothetical protein
MADLKWTRKLDRFLTANQDNAAVEVRVDLNDMAVLSTETDFVAVPREELLAVVRTGVAETLNIEE